ncbi:MAG: 3-isopropylmalate dehydratase small subunit [Chloroflexi bacterium]|nr:3-isopropylmalate dehydratase small subunit [Chloroflexota bacterium]
MTTDMRVIEITGTAIPLRGNDIDTDRVIPARYLRAVTFDGLGEHVFEDDRKASEGAHPFDNPRYAGASVLVVNSNFGSGSSREHAPQALLRWGIKAVVGESFAEIFFGNCYTLGIVCAAVSRDDAAEIQNAVEADPTMEFTVDVDSRTLGSGSRQWPLSIPDAVRDGLVSGTWDAIGELVGNPAEVRRVHDSLPYVRGFGAD